VVVEPQVYRPVVAADRSAGSGVSALRLWYYDRKPGLNNYPEPEFVQAVGFAVKKVAVAQSYAALLRFE
jgi:hypothetical protein